MTSEEPPPNDSVRTGAVAPGVVAGRRRAHCASICLGRCNDGTLSDQKKALLAFLAGAVPIYWGPPTEHIFSNDSYIRCDDLEACAREVKRLDDDDGAYARLLNAPKLSEGGLAILQASNLSDTLIQHLQPKLL